MAERVCVFCAQRRKMTREHVLPGWLNDLLQPRGLTSVAREDGKPFVMGPDVVTKRVCGECNNRWMSALEAEAKRVLSAPILGERTVLSQRDQWTIARWVTKVSLLLDLAHPLDRMVPPSEFDDFYRTGQPPGRAVLLMGGFDEDDAPGLFYRTLLHVPDESGQHPEQPNAYVLTFNVFRVLFQMIGHYSTSATAKLDVRDPRPIERATFCIWPDPQRPALFPPHNVFGTESMAALHESATGYRPPMRLT